MIGTLSGHLSKSITGLPAASGEYTHLADVDFINTIKVAMVSVNNTALGSYPKVIPLPFGSDSLRRSAPVAAIFILSLIEGTLNV